MYYPPIPFNTLEGLTITKVDVGSDEIRFTTKEGRNFLMHHNQDCCENVIIESIHGDINKILGERVDNAVENSNVNAPQLGQYDESFTWTYYTIRTQSETIVIRWYGTSNGYYSETADFVELPATPPEKNALVQKINDLKAELKKYEDQLEEET